MYTIFVTNRPVLVFISNCRRYKNKNSHACYFTHVAIVKTGQNENLYISRCADVNFIWVEKSKWAQWEKQQISATASH